MNLVKCATAGLLMIACFSIASGQQSPEIALLIDASVSMRGFFKTQEIYRLHDHIVQANGGDPSGDYYFAYTYKGKKLKGGLESYKKPSDAAGQVTLIDQAFHDVIRSHSGLSMLWIVTDNIQDPEFGAETEEAKGIGKFYGMIEKGRVVKGYFFPQILQFSGPLFRRDGNRRLTNRYNGKRALIVYALLLNSQFEEDFQENCQRLGKLIQHPAIPCKVSQDDIQASEEIIPIPPDELKDKQVLIIEEGKLISKSKKPFSEGEPIIAKFRIGFRSELKNVYISKPDVKVELVDHFRFFDFGDQKTDFRAKDPNITWDPPKLDYDLYASDSEQYTPPGSNMVTVTIRFDNGVTFSKSLGALARYIFKSRAGDFKGTIKVSLKVRRDQFGIVKPVLDRYGSSDPRYFEVPDESYQTKIFQLGQMFRQTYAEDSEIARIYPIVFQVNYPKWPWIVLLILLALLGAAVYAFFRYQPKFELSPVGPGAYDFRRVVKFSNIIESEYEYTDPEEVDPNYSYETYDTENDEEKQIFLLFPLLGVHRVHVEDRLAATLRRLPVAGVFAFAKRGFQVQKKQRTRLDTSGCTLEITEPDPAEDHYDDDQQVNQTSSKNQVDKKKDSTPDFEEGDYPEYS